MVLEISGFPTILLCRHFSCVLILFTYVPSVPFYKTPIPQMSSKSEENASHDLCIYHTKIILCMPPSSRERKLNIHSTFSRRPGLIN